MRNKTRLFSDEDIARAFQPARYMRRQLARRQGRPGVRVHVTKCQDSIVFHYKMRPPTYPLLGNIKFNFVEKT